jgi:hypothetical protein
MQMEKAIQINGISASLIESIAQDNRQILRMLENQKYQQNTPERQYKGERIITKAEYLTIVNKGTTWFSQRKSKIRHFAHKDGSVWVFASEVEKYFDGLL